MRLFLRRFPARHLPRGLLFALLCAAGRVEATTLIVTSTADGGAGSLRAALAVASDGDTIQFDATLNGQTIGLTSGELEIDKNITIAGPGSNLLTVSRSSGTFRIVHVLPGRTVILGGLTIRNGGSNGGGGVLNDHATLNINNCVIRQNFTQGFFGRGGGVYSDGSGGSATSTILDSSVSSNTAAGYGGGIYKPVSTPGTCAAGTHWSTRAASPDTAPNCAFHDDPGCVIDSTLDTPTFVSGIAYATSFYFRHSYDLENGHDGGVLEISINGGPFIDIISAGGAFPLNGYNGMIMTGTFNPIAGRPAWTGNSGGYVTSYADLPHSAAFQNVRMRFRLATDCSGSGNGWRVDSIYASYPAGCASPSPSGTPTPTPTASPTATPTATIIPCQPVVFAENFDGVIAPALPQGWVTSFHAGPANCTATATPARPLNLSTRMLVQTGDRVGIGGFIITGSAPKQVLLRAIGPSLGQWGVPAPLADPVMELHGPAGFTTIVNDNWRDTQAMAIIATGIPPTNDMESAILVTLEPGAYTAIVQGKNDTSGVGLVEVYDLDPETSQLANISTRAFAGTGGDVVIGGFILDGSANAHVFLWGKSPGISPVLVDPTLELRDSNGVLSASNDDCGDPSPFPPGNPLDACIDISLPSGAYTAILAGKDGGTGVGLIEVYDLN